jgi:exosortase/archaeosortase family protein
MLLLLKINLMRTWLAAHPQGRFVLIAFGVYVAWVLGYEQVLDSDGRLDQALSTGVATTAAALLHMAGVAAGTAPDAPTTVTMHGEPAVFVGNPCNGLVLYVLFAGFVLAYPGSAWRKAWFVPAGIGAIFLLNAGRVAALALNHTYWFRTVEFNHHYTFTFIAYAAILGLWRLWAALGTPLLAHQTYESRH